MLVNQSDIDFCVQALSDHFDLFSSGSQSWVTIHKEPIRVPQVAPTNSVYAGYPSTNEQSFDYIPVSGRFPVQVQYPQVGPDMLLSDLNLYVPQGEIRMRVRQEVPNFIGKDKIERIEVNGLNYNLVSSPNTQNYLGSLYFIYSLKEIA